MFAESFVDFVFAMVVYLRCALTRVVENSISDDDWRRVTANFISYSASRSKCFFLHIAEIQRIVVISKCC